MAAKTKPPSFKSKLITLPATVRLTDRLVNVLDVIQQQYDENGQLQPTLHTTATGLHVYVSRSAREFGT